jgi:hypothetical protein
VAAGFEALEFLDGAAVEALGLGLVAEEEGKAVGVFVEAVEAFGEQVIAVLRLGDFVIVVDEVGADAHQGAAVAVEGLVEEGGAQAGVEAFDAEAGDLVDFFEADDGEGGGGESVFAGVLCGAGFAFRGAGSGGLGGVGSVGR